MMSRTRARTRGGAAACVGCGTETGRVHGYHERTAADVPVDGRRVVVKVRGHCTKPSSGRANPRMRHDPRAIRGDPQARQPAGGVHL
jgi:hypothetical protein